MNPTNNHQNLYILFLQDEPHDVSLILAALADSDYQLDHDVANDQDDFLKKINKNQYDVVLSDYFLTHWSGLTAYELFNQYHPYVPFILVTKPLNDVQLIDCIKQGISDYVVKTNLSLLVKKIAQALKDKKSERECQEAVDALHHKRLSLEQRINQQTHELRQANTKLARVSRLKDEFLANMSHELRTPLNSILGVTQIMQEGIYGEVNEKQAHALQIIEKSSQYLLDLINDILDLSKVEAGKLELNLENVSVAQICHTSLQFVKQLAAKKHIKIKVLCDNNATYLYADILRLKQILINLLHNAVKFTPEYGQIGLEVTVDDARQQIHFIVCDTGIGIDAENIQHLFQAFVQVNSGTSGKQEGTGLGLALVKRLVELHNGQIQVESEQGKGSRFKVTLPWSIRENQMPDSEAKKWVPYNKVAVKKQKAMILLVDDSYSSIELFSDYLAHAGYQVLVANNGEHALQSIKNIRPDLILMDIQMPVMNGLETTLKIRQLPEFSTIPVVALTALAMPEDKKRCLDAGMNDYLSKPVRLNLLLDVINRLLNQH